MTDETVQHLMSVFFVWSYKIVALVIGYLFAKLGYALFLKGVTGEFKFRMQIKGAKADLLSASPGLFLILMGTVIVGIGLYMGMAVHVTLQGHPGMKEAKEVRPHERPEKPQLQRIPPPEEKSDESKVSD